VPGQTFSEELWQGLGNAITDIRQKVVEEPMYGRAVTDTPERLEWPEGQGPEPALGSYTRATEKQFEQQPEKEPENHSGIDLDYC